ncbi:hypothetical protein COV18_01585 [Candidatus Woesearchaeota archaeon CG10_big_fil_rev_8_21_14_0_10_37_12]|nr:MAG: hypothetical protein COV18_01585 [Candidatus Woesearchaeota archaeon CG10_big_fil_rev_8_21_14_0_10_37_12]
MKKEENVLNLFFEEPTKQWHFENIIKTAKISRPQAAQWLKNFAKKYLIKRIKTKGKMPHYIANYESEEYQISKKLFALNKLAETGFFSDLKKLTKAKTIILFGSMSRWDWHKDSDIDLFVYGSSEGLNKNFYRGKLHKEIQIFECKDKRDLAKYKPALLKNILEGQLIKGNLDFVEIHA